LWELLLEAYNDSGGGNPSLQMIDSSMIRAHHCSAGAPALKHVLSLVSLRKSIRQNR
jgi:hypothetical protein